MILKDERGMPGVTPSGSGSRASHGAASASPPKASIPNAAMLPYADAVRRVILDAYKSGYFSGYKDGSAMFGSSASEERIIMLAAEDYGYLISEVNAWERRIASAIEAQRAGTTEIGPVADESAAPQEDAQ